MKQKLLLLFILGFFSRSNAQFDIAQPGDLIVCSNSDFAVFNLAEQTPVILNGLSTSDYIVTYHTSSASANADASPITNPTAYMNFGNPQAIWARVEEVADPSNYELAEFHLRINLQPQVINHNFSICDIDNNPTNGLTTFDLEEIAENIWSMSVLIPTEVELSFYLTEIDAQNQVNALENPFTTTVPNQDIFVRSMYYESGCSGISTLSLSAIDCSGTCLIPQNLTASMITDSSVTLSWLAMGGETQWEILILNAGSPVPLPSMMGIFATTSPFVITGLECPESYDFYVRSVCIGSNSDWSENLFVTLNNCNGSSINEPTNLTACAVDGAACFDLTVNDAEALTIDPINFTISYYTSSAAAQTGTSAIANPEEFCTTVAAGADEIFIRIQNNDSGEFLLTWFTVTAQNLVISTTQLQPLTACDEDSNGSVVFNLTAVEAQLNTENNLAYYADMAHAEDENDPLPNPANYNIGVQNPITTIYIRESAADCDIIYAVQLNAMSNCNVSNVCAGANSLCNSLGIPFPNTVGIAAAESGNNYGCLFETPNPTWFYLPISGVGDVNLVVEQSTFFSMEVANLDADFVAYGPFTSPIAPCSSDLTQDMIVSCSYSGSNAENVILPNAQPGEYYLLMVTNYSDQPGYIRISETGSSQGEINCTGLRLNAFIDVNSNGAQDAGEANFPLGEFHYEVNNNSVVHHITSPTGTHKIYDINPSNSYDLSYTVDPAYAAYYGITAATFSDVSVVAGAGLQDYNFPINVLQVYNDVALTIVANDAPNPGFTYTNTILYSNLGSQTVSGTIVFNHDPLLDINTISQGGTVATPNGFTYNFSNLLPFEVREIEVTMQVPLIPVIALGDLMTNSAAITSQAGDVSIENNESVSAQVVIGSYDPNDKTESRGPQILFSEFSSDDYLYYTIRFENTGTANAINVSIMDVLHSGLDPASVRMVGASHNYVLDRIGDQLTWRFENILLPPSIQDAEGAKGYVHFKVKPFPGYEVGDSVANTASIFFDFNPAIVTNTFVSTFVEVLGTQENVVSGIKVYPNPADHQLFVSSERDIKAIKVYDLLGKTIFEVLNSGNSAVIDISSLHPGLYLLEVSEGNMKQVVKLIIK